MDPELTTRELVERAQSGDRAAQEALALRFRDDLDHFIRLRVGPHLREAVEVDDVVQETFAKALEGLGRFHWRNEASFSRWLRGIAEHVILRVARDRHRGRILFVEHNDAPASTISPSRAERRRERLHRLQGALDGLSPEHREVIVLARLKGLRITEIAARLDRSPNAVSLLLARALAKLRESFGDTESLHLPPQSLDYREVRHRDDD